MSITSCRDRVGRKSCDYGGACTARMPCTLPSTALWNMPKQRNAKKLIWRPSTSCTVNINKLLFHTQLTTTTDKIFRVNGQLLRLFFLAMLWRYTTWSVSCEKWFLRTLSIDSHFSFFVSARALYWYMLYHSSCSPRPLTVQAMYSANYRTWNPSKFGDSNIIFLSPLTWASRDQAIARTISSMNGNALWTSSERWRAARIQRWRFAFSLLLLDAFFCVFQHP